jgi:CheY-like chemotaxis protein
MKNKSSNKSSNKLLIKSLGCCRYPTTVLMVDDNPRFLKHLSAKLDSSFHFNLMTDPRGAAVLGSEEILLKKTISRSFVQDQNLELEADDFSIYQSHQGVRLSSLIDLIQDSSRFNEISVIIVDYAMPGMNGIELCRALEKHPAKKILLTGEADHRIAVDAFNEGLIHRFVLKQTQENILYEELNAAINEMQSIFFSVGSRKILAALGLEQLFLNTNLVNFFAEVFSQKNYTEFYLLNYRGALLVLDERGQVEVFVLETQENLNSYALMARNNDASESLVKALSHKTHLPYLLIAENEDLPFGEWEKYLLPAFPIPGTDLFYAKTSLLPYELINKKIQNYADFIKEHLKNEASFR